MPTLKYYGADNLMIGKRDPLADWFKVQPAAPTELAQFAGEEKDGWIEWHGGECPVPEGTLLDVRYRNGHVEESIPAGVGKRGYEARGAFWRNDNSVADIIAYRVVPQ